jgi:glycosyltransferase involved in cell wall biosynthesis
MKIVLVSSFVPFVNGGARFIVEWLEQKLLEHGHEVERFYLPFVERPDDLFEQIAAFRLIDLSDACDRLIAFRPPAYVLQHPNKVLWFIHHIRSLYDLWGGPYGFVQDDPSGRAIRQTMMDLDTNALREAKKIFTNSKVVAARLQRFNQISSSLLYPPVATPERFHSTDYGDEIVVICRIEKHKRQWLLVEAMRHVRSGVKLRLCGSSMNSDHIDTIRSTIARHQLSSRVLLEDRWISEDEKIERLAVALAIAYVPEDEDSYGYPSLEAAHARKAVITTTDSGGVLELVTDGQNGVVVPPEPQAIAEAMDRLYNDRVKAADMGQANQDRLIELRIDWNSVVSALTS